MHVGKKSLLPYYDIKQFKSSLEAVCRVRVFVYLQLKPCFTRPGTDKSSIRHTP